MARALYTLLLRLALPAVLLLLWWRGVRRPQYRVKLRERLAWLPAANEAAAGHARPIWVHGVSVGEVQAAAPLLRLLHERDPQRPLLLTTATATGHERAMRLLGDLMRVPGPGALQLRYAPFDLPGAARRFLRRHAPCAAVFLETEVWPNLIHELAARRIPAAIVSARVSQRSVQRYRRYAARLIASTLARLDLVAAQSEADAQRFLQLGAVPASVAVTGNVKFDFALPPEAEELGGQLRAGYAPQRPLWVAGSTHQGEEDVCLAAQRELAQRAAAAQRPAPLLVLAPRHPERFETVAKLLESRQVNFLRRSQRKAGAAAAQVLLVDGLGELLAFYAAADAAFVGGSLVPVGGHNLLEPAALGRPVLTGPYSFNAPQAAALLEDAQALVRVDGAQSLADGVWSALTQTQEAAARGARAAAAVAASRGAAARTLAALERLLPPTAAAVSGSASASAPRPSASG
ncbi:MAG: lipid IV(A) 3-deoxy-D-manno-octulosonic acid transferase [Steroidobacteraceae bacterium]